MNLEVFIVMQMTVDGLAFYDGIAHFSICGISKTMPVSDKLTVSAKITRLHL